ncbi:MAG: hypothetical protein Q7R33_04885 [Nitrosarchaeum sp.]|nr:hypothetical protein [Nitrosarchaeum sp.]
MSMKDLKIKLKALAKEIHENKADCKKYQREHCGNDGGFYLTLYRLKYDYRHNHIAYSQLRGRTYEEIESNCRSAGEPNLILIKEIMDAHQEVVQDVRACA